MFLLPSVPVYCTCQVLHYFVYLVSRCRLLSEVGEAACELADDRLEALEYLLDEGLVRFVGDHNAVVEELAVHGREVRLERWHETVDVVDNLDDIVELAERR